MANLMMSAANVIYLISYSVRDMLLLRSLMVVAMMMLAHCYWVNWHQPGTKSAVASESSAAVDDIASESDPRLEDEDSTRASWRYAFLWNLVFVTVNVVQILRLIRERQPVKLSKLETRLHNGPLRSLSAQQVKRMVALGTMHEIEAGTVLVRENEELDELLLILSGHAFVKANGQEIARIHGGQFVGEMSFLTKDKTSAEVISKSQLTYLSWPREAIHASGDREPEILIAMQSALGGDLVRKLIRSSNPEQDESITIRI